MTPPVLETQNLCKHFGALQVANHIDFTLTAGARHAIIGPNGAGKTTFINLISGALRPSRGRIRLNGKDITGLTESKRVKCGIARTFQINTLFQGLSVLENLYLAVSERAGEGHRLWRSMRSQRHILTAALRILERLKLTDVAARRVAELPYGRQRLVEFAIALALDPVVLLLDEPAAGVPNAEHHIILDAIEALPDDMAVLIIEHDMDVVFRVARDITVLVDGAILISGPPQAIATNPQVKAVYLGERKHG